MEKILAIISALLILPTAVMADGLGQKKQTDIPDGLSGRIIRGNYPVLPFYFIKNSGQTDSKVKYYEQDRTHATYFTQDGVYHALTIPQGSGPEQNSTQEIKLSLIDSNDDVEISGVDLLSGKVNYLKGGLADSRINIPTYGAVLYRDIYDGIDLKFHGRNNVLEYDVVVNPGADPREAVFSYGGVKGLRAAPDGGLEVILSSGALYQKSPFIYQEIDGKRAGGGQLPRNKEQRRGVLLRF